MALESFDPGLKAMLPEMPDHLRYVLGSRMNSALRALDAIAREAITARDALRTARDEPENKDALIVALMSLVSLSQSAGASGGMHSKIMEVTAIAGAVDMLSTTGALASESNR